MHTQEALQTPKLVQSEFAHPHELLSEDKRRVASAAYGSAHTCKHTC